MVALLVTALMILVSTTEATAFAPTKLKALGSNSHHSMTEAAVKQLDNEFFGIAKLTKTMTKAMDQMIRANAAVDDDQTHSDLHFDGENFTGGQARLIRLAAAVVSDLQAENAEQARRDLGGALHTIQDFYSHSNWIELGNSGASSDLGRSGHTLSPVAGPTEPTCNGSTLITTKLTSGYYSGEDRTAPISTKCRHGGPFDHSPGSGGINKDLTSSLISPHSSFHGAAATAASQATLQYIRDLKDKLTKRQLKLLFGVGPTLGISIDTTGSMEDIINGVQAEATQIVDSRLGKDDEPSKYVLSPFNDPSTGPLTTTDDPDAFKAAINGLGAAGGDDCPELSMSGMQRALSAMDEGSDLFMFTDADAKDSGLASSVSSLAQSKDIRIYPMMFGSCAEDAAGKRASSHGQKHRALKALKASFAADPVYAEVARQTGGQAFALSTEDAGSITNLADALVRANSVAIVNVTKTLAATTQLVSVPVDSTLSRVTVAVNGAATSLQTVTVTRPDGSAVKPGDADATFVELSEDSAPATIITLTSPTAGSWQVGVAGSGTSSIRVTGESDLDLSSASLVTEEAVSTEPARESGGTLDGQPVAGSTVGLDAVLTGGYKTADFSLIAADGSLVKKLSLPKVVDDEFAAVITVPSVPFLVAVSGTDTTGKTYQRIVPGLVQPQSVVVSGPPSVDVRAGQAHAFTFQVRNLGKTATFTVTASDDQGWITNAPDESLTLKADETATVAVTVSPPSSAADGTTDTVVLDVIDDANPAVHNYAVARATAAAVAADRTPPVVTARPKKPANSRGWHRRPVTVQLAATDESGVKSIAFSLTGAQESGEQTVEADSASVTIRKQGVTTVSYQATDLAGNVSTATKLTVRLDVGKPSFRLATKPRILHHATRRLVRIHVKPKMQDKISGISHFRLVRIKTSSGRDAHNLRGWRVGKPDLSGKVRAATSGHKVRRYRFYYRVADRAGNTRTAHVTVKVKR